MRHCKGCHNIDNIVDFAFQCHLDPSSPRFLLLFAISCRGVCAITYFVFGLLCLDRFTSKAYLSSKDPLVSTAIPQPIGMESQMQPHQPPHNPNSSNYSYTEPPDGAFVPPTET